MLSQRGQVHFRWPVTGTGAQPGATFKYSITLDSATPKVGLTESSVNLELAQLAL